MLIVVPRRGLSAREPEWSATRLRDHSQAHGARFRING